MTTKESWIPPDNPDPHAILKEAREDMRAKRHEIALAKLVWFHENSLAIHPSLAGVRLSYALRDWHDLGCDYPPAMEKIKGLRDTLEERAMKGEVLDGRFHDLAAINHTLKEDSRTADAFKSMDRLNPSEARKIFTFAEQALVKAHAYELCGKYIDPHRDFRSIKACYESSQREFVIGNRKLKVAEIEARIFRNDSAILVGILALNNRNDEAKAIAELAKGVLNDKAFHEEIEAALNGDIPEPWP